MNLKESLLHRISQFRYSRYAKQNSLLIDYLTEVGVDKDFAFCPIPIEELIADAEKLVEKLNEEDVKLLSSLCTLFVSVEHCDSINSKKMEEELESEMDYIEGEWNRLRY